MIDELKAQKVYTYLKDIINNHGQAMPGMKKIAESTNMTMGDAVQCCDYIARQGFLKRTRENIIPFFEENKPNPKSTTWTIWRLT